MRHYDRVKEFYHDHLKSSLDSEAVDFCELPHDIMEKIFDLYEDYINDEEVRRVLRYRARGGKKR